MINFASCFVIGKAHHGWGTFPKCRAGLSYALSKVPNFENAPILQLYPTNKISLNRQERQLESLMCRGKGRSRGLPILFEGDSRA